MLKEFLKNKKAQLGSLTPAVLTLMTLAIIIAIAYIILANFRDTQATSLGLGNTTVGCVSNQSQTPAFRAICNMTAALNDNLVANFSIIVIVVVFAVILGLIAFFRTVSTQ